MRRTLPVLAALAVWVFSLSGCMSSSEGPLVPKTTKTVVLSPDDRTPVIRLPVITAVKIVLPGPTPHSRYAWVVVSNNIKTLVQIEPMTYTVDPTRTDGGYSSATFYGLKPGRSVLRFVLINPNDKIAEPVGHFTVVAEIRDTDEK